MRLESVHLHAFPAGSDPPDAPSDAGELETSPSARATPAGSAPGPAANTLAFEPVYAEHFAFAWRSLRLLGVEEDALDDAAQDVFAAVSRHLAEFAGRSSLRTWIFSIAQRTALNYRRRHRRKVQPLVPLLDGVVGDAPTPHAHAEAMAAAQLIERYCESLDPDRRALFVLALIENVPPAEVAVALGLPLNTVYSRIRSLRAGVERALAQWEKSDE